MRKLDKLREQLEEMEYYNRGTSPFPVYDTEIVEDLRKQLEKMSTEDQRIYDDLPVIACKHCDSLHIVEDDNGNEVCVRCGSNETKYYTNIDDYLTKTEK